MLIRTESLRRDLRQPHPPKLQAAEGEARKAARERRRYPFLLTRQQWKLKPNTSGLVWVSPCAVWVDLGFFHKTVATHNTWIDYSPIRVSDVKWKQIFYV